MDSYTIEFFRYLPSAWQDWVMGIGQIILLIALIPSLMGRDKPDFLTSLITGSVLVAYVFTMWSLDLYWSAAMSALLCLAWFIMALQKISQEKN